MVEITEVAQHSRARDAKIKPGDWLRAVNGHDIADVLDYRFYLAEETVCLDLLRGEKPYSVTIHKQQYDDIGLGFASALMDQKQSCRNKCIFCFIDQLPKGLRQSLYFKDDDARLSFLHGNYITLTNLTERDVARIIEMHISPINISVHTTDPALRVKMMKNPHAGEALQHLYHLAEAGVEIHGQIVLCRGVNDGPALARTMRDLAALYPAVNSVSVVPAGLTKYRDGLFPLTPFSREEACAVIKQVEAVGETLYQQNGARLFFCADELYLTAGLPLPGEAFYEEYPQLENGVGMITSLRTEFDGYMTYLADGKTRHRSVSVATGVAAYPLIRTLAKEMEKAFPGLSVQVYEINNHFFGENITVAGLLTAGDIEDQLAGRPLGEELLLPSAVLRSEGDLFLDGQTPAGLSAALGCRLRFVENDGAALVDAILGDM